MLYAAVSGGKGRRKAASVAGREDNTVFISIRKYHVRRSAAAKLAERVRESFVPLLRRKEGFRGYYLLDGGPGVLISIGIFDTADDALASNESAADWVRNNVLEFTKGMPEIMVGNVLVAEIEQRGAPQ